MPPDVRKELYDILHAAVGIEVFSAGKTAEDYEGDLMLRSAVGRQFEIIGEALGRLLRSAPATARRISEHQGIVGFRKVLIHGYDDVDHQTTWRIIHEKLPVLRREVEELISEVRGPQGPSPTGAG